MKLFFNWRQWQQSADTMIAIALATLIFKRFGYA
jgi:hypothetical protein